MRGTALVVLLCVCAALAAHVLAEQSRARTIAADEMNEPCNVPAALVAPDPDGCVTYIPAVGAPSSLTSIAVDP